jgi:starch-binding outer membrane protein, SusD/RagB family
VKKYLKGAICAAVLVVAASGCNNFLKGGDLSKDPNNPLAASPSQFFGSVQSNLWQLQSGDLSRLTTLWMQQGFGAARQMASVYTYSGVTEGTYDAEFARAYQGGGILDLHKVDSISVIFGDSIFLGISHVVEAWMIGTDADIWGDIPYSQADSFALYPQPVLDPQATIYNDVQNTLSAAIAELSSGAGVGPGGVDLVYGGDPASWIALAHTLKARFFLHTAELVGAPAYASAITEANLGISSNKGDYIANFSGSQEGESNPWFQFADVDGGTGRAGDLIGLPSHLDSLLRGGGDPRDTVYYAKITGSDTSNADQGFFSKERLASTFPQPFVTYNENLLIRAEAEFQTGATAAALTDLNTERASWATATFASGASAWHPKVILAPVGAASLLAIMTEKYILMFQNIEAWNDYKRTCIPALVPIGGGVNGVIPGRLLYPVSERQTNPNIPLPGQQPARNANDPNACP